MLNLKEKTMIQSLATAIGRRLLHMWFVNCYYNHILEDRILYNMHCIFKGNGDAADGPSA
jgi:hypothetical protein